METILEAKGVCKFFGGLKAVNQVDMQLPKAIFSALSGRTVPEKRHFLIAAPEYILQPRESFI